MKSRNIIQTTFDEFGKTAGLRKKASTWYLRSDETVAVLNLQRSQYSPQYYVNVAVWLLALGSADTPTEFKCHIRARADSLVPAALEARLEELLNLESAADDEARREELLALLRTHVLPLMEACATLDGLRTGSAQHLVGNAMFLDREAHALLAGGL